MLFTNFLKYKTTSYLMASAFWGNSSYNLIFNIAPDENLKRNLLVADKMG